MVLLSDEVGRIITDEIGRAIGVVGVALPSPTPRVPMASDASGLSRLGASDGVVRTA